MAKYSFEFKKNVVQEYLDGKGGALYLSRKYNISQISAVQVQKWIKAYQELALSQGINNPMLITRWVNDFRIAGPDALRPKQKGKPTTLKASHRKDSKDIIDTSTQHVKELEDKVLKLEIENAYLKELRRLRLEEEKLLKKQRELSTASEDDTN